MTLKSLAMTCFKEIFNGFSIKGMAVRMALFLQKLQVDPAHSSTSIQVIMDILGVVITVFVSTLMLDSPVGQYIDLVSKLS